MKLKDMSDGDLASLEEELKQAKNEVGYLITQCAAKQAIINDMTRAIQRTLQYHPDMELGEVTREHLGLKPKRNLSATLKRLQKYAIEAMTPNDDAMGLWLKSHKDKP